MLLDLVHKAEGEGWRLGRSLQSSPPAKILQIYIFRSAFTQQSRHFASELFKIVNQNRVIGIERAEVHMKRHLLILN